MNLMTGLHWLASKTAATPADDDAVDPADMGTAFGLDASMAEERHPSAASAAPSSTEDWSRRLERRPQR